MKGSFTAPAGTLAAAVKYTARWIATKPAIPVHGGLMFEIPAFGDRLSIFGFNENATGRASLDVEGDAVGAFIVSGRLLDQLVATFKDRPVTFEQHDSAVSVTAGSWRGTLPAMSEKDYPALPGAAGLAGYVDGGVLAESVRRVGAAAGRDTAKQLALCGMHISFDEDGPTSAETGDREYTLTLMATNRYQAARQSLLWTPDAERAPIGETALVLSAQLVDAVEGFVGPHPVELGWQQGVFSLSTPDRSLVVSTLSFEGSDGFPADGLNETFNKPKSETFTIRATDLALPLKRAALLRGQEPDSVTLRLQENLLTVGVSGMNSGDEEIEARYNGPDTSLMLRSEMMQGALHSAPGDVVVMAFNPGTTQPLVITSPDDPAWRHILVPLRKMG